MSVTKSVCEIYDVYAKGDFATMALRAWSNEIPDSARISYGGEVLIQSSYGSFCHTWTHIAKPFKEFLLDMRAEAFLQKTLGMQSRVYCPEHTTLKLNGFIAQLVASGTINKTQADVILNVFDNEMQSMVSPQHHAGFLAAIARTEEDDDVSTAVPAETREVIFAQALMLKGMKPNPAGMSFWSELWPELVAKLKEEVAAMADEANAAPLPKETEAVIDEVECEA